MKTKLKIIIFVIAMLIIICIGSRVEAASASITATKTTATVGENVTISVNINAAAWNLKVSGAGVSGGNIVGYDSNGSNTSTTKTYSLNTSSVGTYTINLTGDITDGSTDLNTKIGKAVTVTVKAKQTNPSSTGGNSNSGSSSSGKTTTKKPTTTTKPTEEEKKSTDSTLSSLSIAEGAITPEFSKDVKEYAITVPNEVTKLNITATPTDSKAAVSVTEYEELKEGENTITISVTAEDGTTKTDYVIKATRQRKELALEKLVIKYTNQNGEVVELPLTPEFISNIYEYSIETLEYWVKSLDIEALANIEGATIEISGADSLKEGENVITITVKNKITMEPQEEGAEPTEQEETKTYTIKFNKNAEPTIIGKISNWFKGIFGGVSTWYANNQEKTVFGALMFCIVALIGLSIYIIVDYKKYQDLLGKIGKLNNLNNNEIKATSEVENITVNEEPNNIEDIYKDRKKEIETNSKKIEEDQNKEDRPKGGRHF